MRTRKTHGDNVALELMFCFLLSFDILLRHLMTFYNDLYTQLS